MPELDPVLHQPQRLRIMAALHRSRQATFTSLRDSLALTPGNLQSHAQRLVDAGYIEAARVLADARFELRYRITPAGSDAFRAYVGALRALLDETNAADPPPAPAQAPEGAARGVDGGA